MTACQLVVIDNLSNVKPSVAERLEIDWEALGQMCAEDGVVKQVRMGNKN